jgi:hypothetical protein
VAKHSISVHIGKLHPDGEITEWWCIGPGCLGQLKPVTEFNSRGLRPGTGKVVIRHCKTCERIERVKRIGGVQYFRNTLIKPFAKELFEIYGGYHMAGRMAGVSGQTIWRIVNDKKPYCRRTSAERIMQALHRVRVANGSSV